MTDIMNDFYEKKAQEACHEKIVFHNPWISVGERDGFFYSIEMRANRKGVAVLPFKDCGDHKLYLARVERIPAHDNEYETCSVTGVWDDMNETMKQLAVKELHEEAGFQMCMEDMIPLGMVKPSKGVDMTRYLFAVDVTGQEQGEAPGDGSAFEQEAHTVWITKHECFDTYDPLLICMVVKLEGVCDDTGCTVDIQTVHIEKGK